MEEVNVVYRKNLLKNSINIKSIYTIHYFKYKKNFNFKVESHNFWEFVYIDSGSATIVADKNEFPVLQGMCFLHKPNAPHTIYTTDSFSNSVIITFESKDKDFYGISGKILNTNEEQKLLLNKIISETKLTFNDDLADLYLAKMNRKDKVPYGSDQIIKNCIELLFISLLRGQEEKLSKTADIKSIQYGTVVQSIIQILNEKLQSQDKVNLDELSYNLGYSKSYLKTQFKKETGYSIIQYFINLKVEKAKELLSQQHYSISEISDMLGFTSLYYFSRQFKQETHMSPRQYQTSIKSNDTL